MNKKELERDGSRLLSKLIAKLSSIDKKISKKRMLGVVSVLLLIMAALAAYYIAHHNIQVLNPAGSIAEKERQLMIWTVLLGMIVVIPVFAITIGISIRYREGRHAKYSPDQDGNRWLEGLWWLIPSMIIAVLAVMTWTSSHSLDPYKSLTSSNKPLTVDVVALDWKWLFIYPDQKIATVNKLVIPDHVPINFNITADAPMNSFWIPQLGGQIYAMPGMSTQLHLMATKTGAFYGESANISGEHFADMHFETYALNGSDFDKWLVNTKNSKPKNTLDMQTYMTLRKHATSDIKSYNGLDAKLYDSIVNSYMTSSNGMDDMSPNMPDMDMSSGSMSGMDMSGMGGM